jgi:Tfp pilus assembly protein PilZ
MFGKTEWRFEELKDVLRFFHRAYAPQVEVVGYEAPEVLFKVCDQPLPLGETEVRAVVEGICLKARIRVVDTSRTAARAFWLSPVEALPYLVQLFAPPNKRRAPRFSSALRVRSPRRFQGWSLDLSRVGLRLETRAGLGMGQTVPIQLDLNDAFETRLELRARVRWCTPALAEGLTMAGLEFLDLDPESLQALRLDRFLNRLSEQTESDIA